MRKTKRIILISIIILILTIGGVFAYTYFFTDIFLSKKDRFTKYISKNVELVDMINDKDVKKYYQKQVTDAHKNNAEVSLDFSEMAEDNEQVKMINNIKLLFGGSIDVQNGYQDQTITAEYSDTEIISGTLVNTGDFLGFKVNGILGKYIGLKNENLQQFAKNLGIDDVSDIPNKIELKSDNLKIGDIVTQDDVKTLKNKYLTAILECITDDMISEEKYDNGMIYKLTITESKGKEISTKIISLLQEDDIIISKIKEIATSYAKLSSEETEQLISQYKNNLNQMIASINETTEISEDTLDIKVYVSKRKLAKTEILFANELKVAVINNNNKFNIELYEDNQKSTGINIEKTKNENEVIYSVSILNKDNEELFNINAKYTGVTSASSVTSQYKIKVSDGALVTNNLLKKAQSSESNSIAEKESETIRLVMMELITKQQQDSYTSGTEFVIDQKAIQEELNNMTVTKNIDGTYKVVSNTTGNIYKVYSNGKVEQDTTNIQPNEDTAQEQSKYFYINYNNTVTFGEITKIDLNDSNKYALNDKSIEEIEKLFKQLGEKIVTSVTNKMGTMMYAGAADALDKTTDDLKEQEKLAFNAKFTVYEGNKIKGTNVKALVQTVISSNESEKSSSSNRFISITFPVNNGNKVTIDEKNSNYTGLINSSKDYTVKMEYKDGYVNKITVTQN